MLEWIVPVVGAFTLAAAADLQAGVRCDLSCALEGFCECVPVQVRVYVCAHAYPSPSSRGGLWASAVSTAGPSVTVGVSWLGVVTVLSPRGVWPEGCTW